MNYVHTRLHEIHMEHRGQGMYPFQIEMKRCSTCKELLAPESFGIKRDLPDGLNYQCKGCARLSSRRAFARRKEGTRVLPTYNLAPEYLAWVMR